MAAVESLQSQSPKPHVIVVDNASTDGSAEKAQQKFPEIELIKHTENKGYAGGVNAGLPGFSIPDDKGMEKQIGAVRYAPKSDGKTVEFALVVADEWQRHGIGRQLMRLLIEVARQKGYRTMVGDVLAMNTKMFRLVTDLGFAIQPHPDDHTVKRVIRRLRD